MLLASFEWRNVQLPEEVGGVGAKLGRTRRILSRDQGRWQFRYKDQLDQRRGRHSSLP